MKRISLFISACILSVSLFAQPSNDNCIAAIDITSAFTGMIGDQNVTDPYDNTNATVGVNDPAVPGCFSDTYYYGLPLENNVWFSFTVPDVFGNGDSVAYTITTDPANCTFSAAGAEMPSGDTQMALYQGGGLTGNDCPGSAGVEIACNDDLLGGAPYFSGFDVTLVPGQTYYLMIDGWAAEAGEFCFSVDIGEAVCGDSFCSTVSEDFCNCPADCMCDFIDVAYIRYDAGTDGFLFSTVETDTIAWCDQFINVQFPDVVTDAANVYLGFGGFSGTDCAGNAIDSAIVTYDVGTLKNTIDEVTPSGGYMDLGFIQFFELTPADVAAGVINVTYSVDDGNGGTCVEIFTIDLTAIPSIANPLCAVCGDNICGSAENYCACSADCPCDLIELAFIEDNGQGFFFEDNPLNPNIAACSEYMVVNFGFVDPDPNNVWLGYGGFVGTSCDGNAIDSVIITYDKGTLVNTLNEVIASGTYLNLGFINYFELTPADSGILTITIDYNAAAADPCSQTITIDLDAIPAIDNPLCVSCNAGGADLALDGQQLCPGGTIDLATDGFENLSLPCAAGAYEYLWYVFRDPYNAGNFIELVNIVGGGTAPNGTYLVDSVLQNTASAYIPPGALPPGSYEVIGVALCADTAIIDGCFANSAIVVDLLAATDSVCAPACLSSVDYTADPGDGVYQASDFITSTATIDQGSNVTFDAGNYVELNAGFDGDYTFEAIIGGCLPGANVNAPVNHQRVAATSLTSKRIAQLKTIVKPIETKIAVNAKVNVDKIKKVTTKKSLANYNFLSINPAPLAD